MSNHIIGSFSKKFQQQSTINVIGKQPSWMANLPQVDVNIPSKVNRDTQATILERHLNKTGGFDYRLWDAPKIAELPDGSRFLYDGDHSRHLYKLAFPEADKMPVALRNIDTIEELHQLFHMINGAARKNVSAEERFVHEYLSGDVKAKKTAQELTACNLQVYCSNEPNGTVGSASGRGVRIRGFRKSVSTSSLQAVKKAAQLIENTFQVEKTCNSELLEGLAIVLNDYPEVAEDGVYEKSFVNWFKANKVNSQGPLSTSWKNRGGCVHNKQGASLAKGIILDFLQKSNTSPKLPINRLGKRGV